MKPPCDEAVIQSTPSAEPRPKTSEAWILAVTILGSSMAFIDSTVVNVALPAIQSGLGGTVTDMQWVVESYALLLSALILVGGSIGDVFGRRRIFLLGIGIFTIASAACGLAGSIHQLVWARAIQGVGAALLVPGSLSIISSSFGEKERGRAIGTWSGFTAMTTALGPVLGGWLIEHASWHWAFFINVPIGVAVIALSLWRVPESRAETSKKVDWTGALIITVGLTGVTYALIESAKSSWADTSVWSACVIGCGCLVIFPYFEAHAGTPMVPLLLFQSRNFAGVNLLTLFLYAATGIFFFLFPLDLIQVQHYSATATGAAVLPLILLMFVLSRWSGGLVARYGAKLPLVVGPIITAAGFLLFAVSSTGKGYWVSFFPGFVVLGLGMAVTVAPLTTVVMDAVDRNYAGTASGINNAVARVASLLAVAILGLLMVWAFSHSMNTSLREINLPDDVRSYVKVNEIRLAGLAIPPGLDAATVAAVRNSIDRAFVFGFRLIMLVCAGLALAGAAVGGAAIAGRPSSEERIGVSQASDQ